MMFMILIFNFCFFFLQQEMHLLPAMYEVPGTNITKVIVNEDVVAKRQAPAFMYDLPNDSPSTDINVRDINLKVTKSNPKVTALTDSSPQS